MACINMSRAVPPLQTSSKGQQQVLLWSVLTGLQWRFSQRGAVWWSENVACQPQPREPQDDAASQLHTASTGSSRGLQNPQGACQGGEQERGEEEVDCVGRPVAKKQHIDIKSFSMGPAQHKQFHCLMAIHFIYYKVAFIKLECPALESVESMQAAPCKQPCSKQ